MSVASLEQRVEALERQIHNLNCDKGCELEEPKTLKEKFIEADVDNKNFLSINKIKAQIAKEHIKPILDGISLNLHDLEKIGDISINSGMTWKGFMEVYYKDLEDA